MSVREKLARDFCEAIPYNGWLGLEVANVDERSLTLRMPFAERLVGNPISGALHGGVLSAALDATTGATVFVSLEERVRIATLDLRIDYLRPADTRADVLCEAWCEKITTNVAFVRGRAFDEKSGEDFALCTGTFMIFRETKMRSGTAKS